MSMLIFYVKHVHSLLVVHVLTTHETTRVHKKIRPTSKDIVVRLETSKISRTTRNVKKSLPKKVVFKIPTFVL